MRWSKVRKLVEESFAESVRGRVTVHGTTYSSYTACKCGRGWIAIDGKDRADMQSLLQWPKYQGRGRPTNDWDQPLISAEGRHEGCLVEPGEFTRAQLFEACFHYVHSNPHECLTSDNPLIRSRRSSMRKSERLDSNRSRRRTISIRSPASFSSSGWKRRA